MKRSISDFGLHPATSVVNTATIVNSLILFIVSLFLDAKVRNLNENTAPAYEKIIFPNFFIKFVGYFGKYGAD